jgi:hypothetical protein
LARLEARTVQRTGCWDMYMWHMRAINFVTKVFNADLRRQ